MPSLFTLPSVQGRLQASTLSAAAKPSAPPVVRPLAFSASKRAQRQIHVCQAAGRNEPKYDENDYITAGVEAGAYRVRSGCFRQGYGFIPAFPTRRVTCSSPSSAKWTRYTSEDRFEGHSPAGLCRYVLSGKPVAKGLPASRTQLPSNTRWVRCR